MTDTTFYQGKTVLVTGGTGFVGTHFVEELLRLGAHVRVPIHHRPLIVQDKRIETMPADLTSLEDCRRAMRGVEYVVHAAGPVGAAGVTASYVMQAIRMHLVITSQLLEAAWYVGPGRFLLFSSSTVYPAADHAVTEEEAWNGLPHLAYHGYGWMRRYFERLGEFVAAKSNLQIALVRPTAIYGRHDNFDPATCHVIPALIHRAVEKQNPFVVWGNGEEVRDFLHVTDLVRGCLLALEKHAVCDPVNLGYGQAVTVKQIVQMILKAAGHDKAELVFDTTKPNMIPLRMVDITKARRLLGFEPRVTLEEGLTETVCWYQGTLT